MQNHVNNMLSLIKENEEKEQYSTRKICIKHFHLPVSATFLIVCLKAQIIESRTSLNCAGGMARKAGKQ